MKASRALGALAPIFLVILLGSAITNCTAATAVTSWGTGQTTPAGLTNAIALAAAVDHTLALTSDGTVVAWGYDFDAQCDVPSGLNNVAQVAAGEFFSLALKRDGSVVAWGDNQFGQASLPQGLGNVRAVSAGRAHALALKADGTVAAWGADDYGQCDVPVGLTAVKAILAEWNYSVALRSNGTVVAWGANDAGQTAVPALTDATALAGNLTYCLALRANGTVVAWGRYPGPLPAVGGFNAIAAGEDHALGLAGNGTVVAWGGNEAGQIDVPKDLAGVSTVSAGWNYSVALASSGALPVLVLMNPSWSAGAFTVSVATQTDHTYTLQYKTELDDTWTDLTPVAGSGGLMLLTDSAASSIHRFYRVRQQ